MAGADRPASLRLSLKKVRSYHEKGGGLEFDLHEVQKKGDENRRQVLAASPGIRCSRCSLVI